MLLPALNKARQAAQAVACASNMRQIALAARMYANENGGRVPPAFYYTSTNFSSPVYRYTFFSLLAPSLGVKYDPGAGVNATNCPWLEHTVFQCPTDNYDRPAADQASYRLWGGPCSYSVNGYVTDLYDVNGGGASIFGMGFNIGAFKLSQIKLPSTTLLLVENQNPKNNNVYGWGNNYTVNNSWEGGTFSYTRSDSYYATDIAKKRGYHDGVSNWAFVDGHVAAMAWVATMSPRNLWRTQPDLQAVAAPYVH
jgi:prepilin-type processing-associated H-X9-DG protein